MNINQSSQKRDTMPAANFNGLRVLSLESRRAVETAKLIRTYGGEPLVAPAMREVSLESQKPVLEFAEALLRGAFDLVIFTTGVGVKALLKTVSEHMDREQFLEALRKVRIAARGPKSSSALRELQIPISVIAPEPFTWRALMGALEAKFGADLGGMNIAVQEYGTSNPELLTALAEKSISITRLPVYQWALPEDTQPLREAVIALAHGHVDVVLFMNAGQVMHLFLMAERMGYTDALHEGFRTTVVGSIGPSNTEGLNAYGVVPDYEPTQSKMGFLIKELAERSAELLQQKRMAAALHVPDDAPPPPISPLLTGESVVAPASKPEAVGVDFLHEIGSRITAADPLHVVLNRIVDFACSLIKCDSCFVYVLEDDQLVLRASKNPHSDVVDRLGIWLGQGITGWVGWHREPVAIPTNALQDPRFKRFRNLAEDSFEAFLSVPILCRSKLVGVINLQHRKPYYHTDQEVRLLSAVGYLVGAELERARLESENSELSDRLESRKVIERAKGVLQRDFGLDEESAYRAMQRESRQRRKSMREIAEAILLNEDLRKTRLNGREASA
ncbi:uroporphyrinogen-III synthase [Occallatibacter riparius]|uniref:Uroporphyrinogen-III synthase n=1 Tax=Occallatibacter riparius TaxID=1002689 RepID=A0A9J7BWA2_9BACT|nr:uroporphyrinogen-III synthase [Occallatibacter riparius]UWZ86912.1 uroporphyrinogen-III synthase [Occallatibacter riparius]